MAEPTREQLVAAFVKADDAGDTEAARVLAQRIADIDASDGLTSGDTSAPEGQVVIGYGTNEDGSRYPMYGPPEQQPFAVNEREALARGTGTVVEGLAALPGLVINPIGQAIYNATGYGDQTYDVGDTIRGTLGLPQMEEGVGRTVGEFASGGLGASAAARGANALLQYGPGVATNVLNVLGRTPIRDAAAGAGAGVGLELGGDAGEAIAGDTGRVAGEVVGALGGGVAGYSGANRTFRGIAGERVLNETAQAAADLGIQQIAADTGGRGTRFATGAVRSTFGGIPIAEGAEQSSQSAGRAANRIAADIGRVADDTGAGQAARRGLERFQGQSLRRAEDLYEAIPIQPKVGVQLNNTRSALTEITSGFQSNKQLSELWANNPKMKETLEALSIKKLPARETLRTPLNPTPAQMRNFSRIEDVPLNKARSDQSEMNWSENAKGQYKDPLIEGYGDLPVAVRMNDGEYWIIDGNHRTVNAINSGQTNAKMHVIDAKSYDPENAGRATASSRSGSSVSDEELLRELGVKPESVGSNSTASSPSDFAPSGQLSWEDMKAFRTMVGEIIGQPGVTRDGSDIAQLRGLYAALSEDMAATAAAQGPKALQAWRRANQYWRGRQDRIDNVFATILGKDGLRSDEDVFKSINRWAQEGGDFNRLARTIRSLPDDEANTVRATLVQRMGLANKGQQAGDGTIFSPRKFATEWQGMDKRAKAVLFPDAKHRADLEKLARVAEGMKAADEFRNWSGTAVGVNSLLTGSVALANAPVAIAMGLAQFGAGKLLVNPKFARIMASTLELPPERQGRVLTERLGVLATQEPAIAGEVNRLQQALMSANDNMTTAAVAEEPTE